MLALSLIASCSLLAQGATDTTTYVLKISEESKALFKLSGAPTPAAKLILRPGSTFAFERTSGTEKISFDGTYSLQAKDLVLTSQDLAHQIRGQLHDDRMVLDGLVYAKVSDNISGLWLRSTPSGPDKTFRFRFNDKGRFWFQQGDAKPKNGLTPIGSEGTYKIEGSTVYLYYQKIDDEEAPESLAPGKLTISDDRSHFLAPGGQRYERA